MTSRRVWGLHPRMGKLHQLRMKKRQAWIIGLGNWDSLINTMTMPPQANADEELQAKS